MAPKTSLFVVLALTFASSVLHAATSENMEQEYQQERKIALRDPKVRGAYDEADRKLEAKIVQIDPALANYVHHRSTEPASTPEAKKSDVKKSEVKKPEVHAKPAAAPATVGGATYQVKKGDTLGAIASRYSVTVAALKSANHITDEKKLAVGQTLRIP
jgi:LysM repeat protein